MLEPARLIWANNLDSPADLTLTGTGYSPPIPLDHTAAVFLSVVIGDPPQDMKQLIEEEGEALLTVSLQVCDAGGTWLPVASLEPRWDPNPPPGPHFIAQPNGRVSVGLFGCSVSMVLPSVGRIRWDAFRFDRASGHGWVPATFGQTVISLYGR
ncbi:hypothetical protein [Streptomyces sp. NPDC059819]|uniref:hypothetical protein n=1 Tax=Streptomyces sp. NPDC059819 TaxID=3346963 RepID=UPI0036617226